MLLFAREQVGDGLESTMGMVREADCFARPISDRSLFMKYQEGSEVGGSFLRQYPSQGRSGSRIDGIDL